ncbi:MAG: hypothetical protein Q6368_003065 [Candidatus Baldrarchaeota archaeon]
MQRLKRAHKQIKRKKGPAFEKWQKKYIAHAFRLLWGDHEDLLDIVEEILERKRSGELVPLERVPKLLTMEKSSPRRSADTRDGKDVSGSAEMG